MYSSLHYRLVYWDDGVGVRNIGKKYFHFNHNVYKILHTL